MDYKGPSVATYEDIARAAGVSTATVSRVLSGNGSAVSAARTEKVRRAAAALGYRSNRAARTLRRRQADAVGLVFSDVENPFFASIARAVEDVAARRGHAVVLCNTDEDLERERFYLDLMMEEQVAGVIVAPSTETPDRLLPLADAGIPTVTVDRTLQGNPFDSVLVDNRAGTEALVRDLLDHRHRRIAAIIGTTAATPSRERLDACAQTVASVPGASLVVGEGKLRDAVGTARTMALAGRLALELLETSAEPPTAFFCGNAVILQGVLGALHSAGQRVPDDVALVGFDDLPLFALLERPLTVAAQPTEELGRTAAELLFQRMDDPAAATRGVRLRPDVRFRHSCGGGH
ncbi:HTH-type transcriptional regulator KdgR [Streptomyces malaysiensis subsp. malaysiensis]|nr:LacI family DNA-binding transcriptional regulator [Streptomyces sp. SID8382]AUA17212.1 HTH-type transcriptional regulator KdgR [Streptomyces sp. M56]